MRAPSRRPVMRTSGLKVLALLSLTVTMLACSSVQPSTTPAAMSDKPVSGGVFRAPVSDDPFDFDMSFTGSSNTNPFVIKNAYASLLRFKVGADIPYSQAVVEPYLASSWEVSPDVKTYTFHLNKGVKYAN